MASKLSKWNVFNIGPEVKGIISSYSFMGAFNYYCITSSPTITNPKTNGCDKIIRMLCKSNGAGSSWEILTKLASKGGMGLVTPSFKLLLFKFHGLSMLYVILSLITQLR